MQQQMRTLAEQAHLARAQRLAIQQSMAGGSLFTPPSQSPYSYGEQPKGPKSHLPTLQVESWSARQAYQHWLEGQGQPVEVPFRSLHFKDGQFRANSDIQKEVARLTKQAQQKEHIIIQDIDFKNQGFEFNPSNPSDYVTYGNIMVDVQGTLTVAPQGNWQFDGNFSPGFGYILNGKPLIGDVFNFDSARHRSLFAELATRTIHALPGTSYIIYFLNEHLAVTFNYQKPIEGKYK